VLAGRAIRHAVVELKAAVKLGRDGKGVDREVAGALVSSDARRGLLLGSTGADNGAAGRAKGASTQEAITLAEVVLAGPAAETESTKLSELAGRELAKVPAALHAGVALVVGVSGAAERLGLGPRGSKVVLDGERRRSVMSVYRKQKKTVDRPVDVLQWQQLAPHRPQPGEQRRQSSW
jgi:hypothetical protein